MTMKTKSYSLRSRYASIRFAVRGIRRFFKEEPNARLHAIATVIVAIVACCLQVSHAEMIALVIVTGGVWIAEAFNTAVERIMDLVSPDFHPEVGFVKDVAAGAVLMASLTALVTGSFIFIPKLF